MQTRALTHTSSSLGKDMHMMIYGHRGVPFLAFPTQDGMCRQLEDFGLIEQIRDYIEGCGKLVSPGGRQGGPRPAAGAVLPLPGG